MVGANGFEPSTSWSRTRKSENLKPCGCRTYKPHHPKNPASIGPQSPQRNLARIIAAGRVPIQNLVRLPSRRKLKVNRGESQGQSVLNETQIESEGFRLGRRAHYETRPITEIEGAGWSCSFSCVQMMQPANLRD